MAKSHNTPLALKAITQNITQSKIFQTIFVFLAWYILLIIISPVLLALVIYRSILTFVVREKYNEKLSLLRGIDAISIAGDRFANVNNITIFSLVKGGCDIHAIRDRVKMSILTRSKEGDRPFQKLLNGIVRKFGFFWWVDKSESMDFNKHIRYCPGAADLDQVYKETEVMSAIANLADDLWSEERPRWEFVIVPKVKRDDEAEGEYYCIALRISHAYVDGVSAVQFIRNCLVDQPSPKLMFDPVNPPIPHVPFYQKALLYFQTFLLGPYETFKFAGCEKDPIFSEGTLTGENFYGRMKTDLTLEMMRRIRKVYNCDTQSVLHSALTGAMKTMALRKGLPVPEKILAFVPTTRFPYPNEYPFNSAVFTLEQVPMNIPDPVERLAGMNSSLENKTKRYKIEFAFMVVALGILPVYFLDKIGRLSAASYILSNAPGIVGKGKIFGSDVEVFTGFAPMVNAFRYSVAVSMYDGKFCIGFAVGKTKVIANRRDMDDFIREFENEVRVLEC